MNSLLVDIKTYHTFIGTPLDTSLKIEYKLETYSKWQI